MTHQRPARPPAEVLDDVARAVGTEVAPLGRLPGGENGGAVRVRLAGRADAVLKAVPRTHRHHLDETWRARRIVEHLRGRGYPTPAWLAVGATPGYVWHLTDVVDAAPAAELTPSLVEQLMGIVELQAGQAAELYDHWSYAWRVATGQAPALAGTDVVETPEQLRLRRSVARVPGCSPAVASLVRRLRLGCAGVGPPGGAPDVVHADLATPGNVLVRDGAVVAVVDIGNAGSGTRAIDLTTLVWYTFGDPRLSGVRERLWRRILVLVGREQAAVLAASHVLHMLELPIRLGRHEAVPGVVERGHRALDELAACPQPSPAEDQGPAVVLVDVDETVLGELVRVATAAAAAEEVTPPLTGGSSWDGARVAWLRAYHRDRRGGLDGPRREATWAVVGADGVVGSVRLRRTAAPGVLETGIWVARGVRGRGVGAAALAAVVDRAAALGATAVRADTTATNAPALGLLERAGFRLERTAGDGPVRAVLELRP